MVEKLQADSVPQSEQGETDNTPQYVTTEQVNASVNSAITARSKKLEAALNVSNQKIQELTDLVSKLASKEEPGTKDVPDVVSRLEAQVAKMSKESDSLKQEKAAEIAKRKDSEKRQAVHDLLAATDIKPETIKFAMSHLIDGEKLISYNNDGELVFQGPDGEMDVKEGIKQWTSTEDGKVFRPAKGIKGSGDTSYKSPRASDKVSLNEEKEKLSQAIRNLISGQQ